MSKGRKRGLPKGWVIQPRQVRDWLGKAYGQIAEEDYEAALATCKRCLRYTPPGSPERADALQYMAIANFMLQHFEETYVALSEALAIRPDDADMWYNRGLAARLTSRQGHSVRDFERALALESDPEMASRISEELRLAREWAEHDRAMRGPDFTLDQLIEQEALYHQATDLMEARKWEQAERAFRSVIAMGDCMPQPWGNIATCLIMQRRFDEAEAALKRALEINPNYEHARFNLEQLPYTRQSGELPETVMTRPFDGRTLSKSILFRKG